MGCGSQQGFDMFYHRPCREADIIQANRLQRDKGDQELELKERANNAIGRVLPCLILVVVCSAGTWGKTVKELGIHSMKSRMKTIRDRKKDSRRRLPSRSGMTGEYSPAI